MQAADRDADGISIAADALSLNGGSIRSAAGADAELDLGGHALVNAAEHKVDGSKATPPAVDGVGISSRPQDGEAYGAGEAISVWLNFSHQVEVAGTPMLAIGGGARRAKPRSVVVGARPCGSATSCRPRTGTRTASASPRTR